MAHQTNHLLDDQLTLNNTMEFAEVQYYFLSNGKTEDDDLIPHALVLLYGQPHADILEASYHTLWACKYNGLEDLVMVRARSRSFRRTIKGRL